MNFWRMLIDFLQTQWSSFVSGQSLEYFFLDVHWYQFYHSPWCHIQYYFDIKSTHSHITTKIGPVLAWTSVLRRSDTKSSRLNPNCNRLVVYWWENPTRSTVDVISLNLLMIDCKLIEKSLGKLDSHWFWWTGHICSIFYIALSLPVLQM